MANLTRFFIEDDDPLRGLLPAARAFSFAQAAAFQAPYFRSKFPPKGGPKTTPGWNRNSNLATGCRLQQHVAKGDIVELSGLDHSELPPVYEGTWFDSGLHSFATDRLAAAFILDQKRRPKVEDEQRVFYATNASASLVIDSSEDGRSEFIDAQFTLEAFHLYLQHAEDEQLRQSAASWELLPLPDDYASYRKEYRGDAIIRVGSSEVIVCSPAIHGWWKTLPVHEFLESLPSRLGNKRFILLSPLGFRRWLRIHNEAPWQNSTSQLHDGSD